MTRAALRHKWLMQLAEAHGPRYPSPFLLRRFANLLQEIATARDIPRAAATEDDAIMILNMLSMSVSVALESPCADEADRALMVAAMETIFLTECMDATGLWYSCAIFWEPIGRAVATTGEQMDLTAFLINCLGRGSDTFQEGAIGGLRSLGAADTTSLLRDLSVSSPSEWVRWAASEAVKAFEESST